MVRTEIVLRRDRLRRMRVNSATDLRAVPWATLVPRCFRFVAFEASRRNTEQPQWIDAMSLEQGVKAGLQRRDPADRRRLRRRLQPTELQHAVEGLLRELEAELRAGGDATDFTASDERD